MDNLIIEIPTIKDLIRLSYYPFPSHASPYDKGNHTFVRSCGMDRYNDCLSVCQTDRKSHVDKIDRQTDK